MVLGVDPVDIDIVIEGDVLKAARDLNKILKGKLLMYKDFNTASIITRTGNRVDLAGARTETYPSPAELPKVIPATIKEDLQRRDFTINALCMSLNRADLGELYDPFSGVNDIRRGLVRVLHDQSFVDDPTRIFRALRYKNRFGFRLESATDARLRDAIAENIIGRLSGQRVLNELRLVFAEKRDAQVLKDLVRYGVVNLPQASLKMLDRMGDLKLYAFLAHTRFKNLPLPGREADLVREVGRLNQIIARLSRARHIHQVYEILAPLTPEVTSVIPAIKPALKRKVDSFRGMRRVRPLITGNDLKRMGLKPGPSYKRLLARAFQQQLDGKISARNKNKALEALKKHVS
jgi:tRNA nucleotidyltransferase (CCA-adding enzyme)